MCCFDVAYYWAASEQFYYMAVKSLQVGDLRVSICGGQGSGRIVYMLYPDVGDFFGARWLEDISRGYGANIAMVYVPQDKWNDYLTPWPEPGEAPGFPPFGGDADGFLARLRDEVLPACEGAVGLSGDVERDLIGVSLSGLFTLWQWMGCDLFKSVACLSGSFWYAGFMDWFEGQPLPEKGGKIYFLLGRKEPHARVRAYRSVGVNTEAIYERFSRGGFDTRFDWVPGAHIDNALPRAEKALAFLLGQG